MVLLIRITNWRLKKMTDGSKDNFLKIMILKLYDYSVSVETMTTYTELINNSDRKYLYISSLILQSQL